MMKQLAFLGGAIAVVAALAPYAQAANPACSGSDEVCIDTNDADAGPAGNPLVDATSQLPAQGIVAAGDEGYLFFDGDQTNPDPLGGYLGINGADAALISASDSGNFNRLGNNVSPPEPPSGLPVPLPLP